MEHGSGSLLFHNSDFNACTRSKIVLFELVTVRLKEIRLRGIDTVISCCTYRPIRSWTCVLETSLPKRVVHRVVHGQEIKKNDAHYSSVILLRIHKYIYMHTRTDAIRWNTIIACPAHYTRIIIVFYCRRMTMTADWILIRSRFLNDVSQDEQPKTIEGLCPTVQQSSTVTRTSSHGCGRAGQLLLLNIYLMDDDRYRFCYDCNPSGNKTLIAWITMFRREIVDRSRISFYCTRRGAS